MHCYINIALSDSAYSAAAKSLILGSTPTEGITN